MLSEKDLKKIIVGILVVALIIIAIYIVLPVISAIVWGLILAYIFYPVYKFFLKRIKEPNISSILIVLLIIFLIFIPIWFFFPILSKQIFNVYSYFQTVDLKSLLEKIFSRFSASPSLQVETLSLITNFVSKIITTISAGFSNTILNLPSAILEIVVALFTFFFALRDGAKLKTYILEISPFNKTTQESLSKEFSNITGAVVFGYIVTGIIQGLATGLGLLVAGVPQALLLTIIATFAAIIPVLGAWAIWIPASIYLIASGHIGAGIGLIIYGSLFISWIDNIIRVWLVSRKTKTSSAIILIGMIGGLIVFGVIGLIIGPLILSYLIILLDAYKQKKFSELFSG